MPPLTLYTHQLHLQNGQHAHSNHVHSHHKCCNRNHGPAAGIHALPSAGTNGNAAAPAGSSSSTGLSLADLQAMPPTELAQLQAALKKRLAMQLAAQQQQQQQQSTAVSATSSSSNTTNPTPAAAATTAAAGGGGGGGGGGSGVPPSPLALDINPAAVPAGGGSSGSSSSSSNGNGGLTSPPLSMDIFEAVKLGSVSMVKRLVQAQEAQVKQQQQQQQQPPPQGGRAPSPSSNGSLRAFLSQRDADGHTLMHWAAKRGDLDLVRFLAEKGAPLFGTSADGVGMEPIHWAVTDGHLPVLHYLVSKGAYLNARDKQLCTPLLIAAQYGQTEVVAYLVKNGADTTLLDTNNDSVRT